MTTASWSNATPRPVRSDPGATSTALILHPRLATSTARSRSSNSSLPPRKTPPALVAVTAAAAAAETVVAFLFLQAALAALRPAESRSEPRSLSLHDLPSELLQRIADLGWVAPELILASKFLLDKIGFDRATLHRQHKQIEDSPARKRLEEIDKPYGRLAAQRVRPAARPADPRLALLADGQMTNLDSLIGRHLTQVQRTLFSSGLSMAAIRDHLNKRYPDPLEQQRELHYLFAKVIHLTGSAPRDDGHLGSGALGMKAGLPQDEAFHGIDKLIRLLASIDPALDCLNGHGLSDLEPQELFRLILEHTGKKFLPLLMGAEPDAEGVGGKGIRGLPEAEREQFVPLLTPLPPMDDAEVIDAMQDDPALMAEAIRLLRGRFSLR